jgi:hypothetical protein
MHGVPQLDAQDTMSTSERQGWQLAATAPKYDRGYLVVVLQVS